MSALNLPTKGWSLVVAFLAASVAGVMAQSLSVQVLTPPTPPPTALVQHGETWHYRLGTDEPQADWQTAADAALDASWLTGPGGLGYNDGDDATNIRAAMSNICNTVYLRRTFTIAAPVNPTDRLQLMVDYDDGFVAWLDGEEVRRVNVSGSPGSPVASTALAINAHEARGYQSLSVDVFDLGAAGSRLAPGPHVLSIICVNDNRTSSDLTIIADLSLASDSPVVAGAFLAVARTNRVTISGTNTMAGATRVLVNGVETAFDPPSGHWSNSLALVPGRNEPLVQAVDALGTPLFTTNALIVADMGSTTVGGTIAADTTWSSAMGVLRASGSIFVAPGVTLTVEPGTVVLMPSGAAFRTTNGAIRLLGAEGNGILLAPADGTTIWNEISADGATSSLTLRHVEAIAGAVKFRGGATGLMEDSYVHDYKNGTVPIGGCTSAQTVTVRRCHFRTYHETLWQNTLMTIEDTLFELADNSSSDALDYDGVPVGSVIRRCTFRHGPRTNTDAIDIGPFSGGVGSTNTMIESCLMMDFPNDKGVSIGEGSYGTIVSNCLIYGTESGIGVKDSPGTPPKPPCTANVINCTIANCEFGFRCYNKSDGNALIDGGQITNAYNNILYSNLANIGLFNGGIAIVDHSDVGGTWPGTGNLDTDPLFLNAARGDYRLAPNSPCIGAGVAGASLGPVYPVGAPMASSHPHIQSIERLSNQALVRFWANSETNTYSLLRRDHVDNGPWVKVTDIFPHPRPRLVTVTNGLSGNNTAFFKLVSPRVP